MIYAHWDFFEFDIATTAVLGVGVLVALWVGLRVYASEKILDAKDRIRSLVEVLAEIGVNAVERIGKDVYFQKPWFSTWGKTKWHITAIVLNTEANKADVSFIASRQRSGSNAFQEAFFSISSEIELHREEKNAIDSWEIKERRQFKSQQRTRRGKDSRLLAMIRHDLDDSTFVLLFGSSKV